MKALRSTKALVLTISLVVALVIVATSFTLAFWGGNPSVEDNTAVIDGSVNSTYKYLVFAPNDSVYSEDYKLRWDDTTQKFKLYEYDDDTYDYDSQGSLIGNAVTITSVRVIGYTGTQGEYENLIIPSTINYGNSQITVNKIQLDMQIYDALKLIKTVQIPLSVTNIEGNSFSGLENLSKVVFLGRANQGTLQISENAFIGTNATFYFKASSSGVESSGVIQKGVNS